MRKVSKRALQIVGASSLFIAVGVAILCIILRMSAVPLASDYLATPFEGLRRGASKDMVRHAFGTPTSVGLCGDSIWWQEDKKLSEEPNNGKCVEWWAYGERDALVAYGVGFDKNGAVVSKYRFVSQ